MTDILNIQLLIKIEILKGRILHYFTLLLYFMALSLILITI